MMPPISTPAFQEELQERGAVLMTEGQAILDLARSLGRFEDATGQRLAVVDAIQIRADATIAPMMAETITDPDDPAPDDCLVEPVPVVGKVNAGQHQQAELPAPVPPAPAPDDKAGSPWSDEEKAEAVRMKSEGFSASHIAKVIGRPHPATRAMLAKLAKEKAPPPAEVAPAPPVPPAAPAPKAEKPASAVVKMTAAPAPAPAEPEPPKAETFQPLTRRQQLLVDHVGRLPDDFEPADDLWLAESLAKGTPIDVIADQLGCDSATARARFRAMLTDGIKTPKGTITTDGQADLLVALRYRAAD